MIKGHLQIELHNHKSGSKERIEQDNLVTNATTQLVDFCSGADGSRINSTIMPLYYRVLGGLLIFEDPLTESVNNIHFPGDNFLTGYAGRSVDTSDLQRGSLNSIESTRVQNGYMTVWDFSTAQANGQISSMALTHSLIDQGHPVIGYVSDALIRAGGSPVSDYYSNPIEYKDNYMYCVDRTNDAFYRAYIPTSNYGILDNYGQSATPELLEENVFTSTNNLWVNGGDGNYYAVSSVQIDTTQSSIYSICRITIRSVSKETLANNGNILVELTPWHSQDSSTITNVDQIISTSDHSLAYNSMLIVDGVLYVSRRNPTKLQHELYIVNLSEEVVDPTVNTTIHVEEPTSIISGDTFIYTGNTGNGFFYALSNGVAVAYRRTGTNNYITYQVKPDGTYKKFSKVTDGIPDRVISTCGSDSILIIRLPSNGFHRALSVPCNYLGTICNIQTPFEKTTTTSMKVKYTITNV